MIGTSIWEYVFIRACIFFLKLIAPLSVIYALITWIPGLDLPFLAHVPRSMNRWILLEAAFYTFVYLPRKTILRTSVTEHPVLSSRDDRRRLFQRCHDNIPDPERYLQRWFKGAPMEEIKRENVKDFFRWAFLNSGDRDPDHEEELEEYADKMEKRLGMKLAPGRGKAECLRLTLDEVDMVHRCLVWYLLVSFIDLLVSCFMFYKGYSFYRTKLSRFLCIFPSRPPTLLLGSHLSPAKSLTYWHRPHTSRTRLPVLFIHGIGIGLYPYATFLADLASEEAGSDTGPTDDGQVGVIAIEIMAISARITAQALSSDDMCEDIHRILKKHGWEKFVLVSHSYGSIVATHLLREPRIARDVGPILFIDPITFLLHLPDVAYNFICRKPTHANEHQLSYFASKDMGISHTLFRRFFWADNILWKEDVENHDVTVALAGRDLIVDTRAVAGYLTGVQGWTSKAAGAGGYVSQRAGSLQVMWFEDLDHAQVFEEKKTRRPLVGVVRAYSTLLT